MSTRKSCLTDKPLHTHTDDKLQAMDYVNALCDFIKNADTPVTIGIQGGWGSGKTSLITVLQEQLNEDQAHPALCVTVNAWEHSLFHTSDSKADVVLSLLDGLARGVKASIDKAKWLDGDIKTAVNGKNGAVTDALDGLKKGVMFAMRVGLHLAANYMGGNLPDGENQNQKDQKAQEVTPPPLAQYVHDLKESLENLVDTCTKAGKPQKVVFFIDDLDRVPPPTAVEILDTTKNIFDIPNCVFVLAIDYDVVVKGLEEKFGQKTAENEREFRQYFDKIIQIPFTMPVGAYGDALSALLLPSLQRLGIDTDSMDPRTMDHLAEDGRWATGGIPRSIKRIVNTLSLLQHINNSRRNKKDGGQQVDMLALEALFIIVAIHINFPEVCRRLMERPNFLAWNFADLNMPWKLNYDKHKDEIKALEKDKFFDDPWEQVLFCLCSQSTWLKGQVRNLSHLLNRLAVVITNDPQKKQFDQNEEGKLSEILDSIRVVSIDSDTAGTKVSNAGVRDDDISRFCREVNRKLVGALPKDAIYMDEKNYALRKAGERLYVINELGDEITDFCISWATKEDLLNIGFYADRSGITQRASEALLQKYKKGYECKQEGRSFKYYMEIPFTRAEFSTTSVEDLIPRIVDLYKATRKAQEALTK